MTVIRSRSFRLIVNVSMWWPGCYPNPAQGDILIELAGGHSHGVPTAGGWSGKVPVPGFANHGGAGVPATARLYQAIADGAWNSPSPFLASAHVATALRTPAGAALSAAQADVRLRHHADFRARRAA